MNRRRFMQLTFMGGIGMTLEGDERRIAPIRVRRYAPFLTVPNGFLVVQHDALNDTNLNLEAMVEECLALGEYTHGRPVVPACEGDLFMLPGSGDLIFTHQNLGEVTRETFEAKRKKGKAAYFKDVLEKYSSYLSDGFLVPALCLELKRSTSLEAIAKAQAELSKAGLNEERVYFDSFFSHKLDCVNERYAKSLHLMARFGSVQIMLDFPQRGYDLVTVPRALALGEPHEPTIYGAVSSVDEIQKAAADSFVLGVYARIKEGNPVKMFMRSMWR